MLFEKCFHLLSFMFLIFCSEIFFSEQHVYVCLIFLYVVFITNDHGRELS